MFEKLTTPEEIFSYKLGAALTMEKTTLEMLGELEMAAQRDEIKQLLHMHMEETRGQVSAIEQCFVLLGEDVDDHACPAIAGMHKEGKVMIKKTDATVIDSVVLSCACEVEHHEIAVYETLVMNAEARGAAEVARLLQTSLDQEKASLVKLQAVAKRIAREGIAVPA